ncbi:hypothetical protein TNCV_3415811 [Trichonephila clavipes]|nr:hypothetical protein TNCV_3415811 [Trichonephila clavipes]
MKLNQIASEERSGLSSAQTENPVLSALADRLQEINLRVGRLQEASAVTARKSGDLKHHEKHVIRSILVMGTQKGFLTIKEAKVYGDTEVEKLECAWPCAKAYGHKAEKHSKNEQRH